MEFVFLLIILTVLWFILTRPGNKPKPSPRKQPTPDGTTEQPVKYHQGYYKVENPEKYRGDIDNVFFRSDWERKAFVFCDRSKRVKYWASEELDIPYYMKGRQRPYRYVPDLMIYFNDKTVVMVEIKPKEERQNPSKKNKSKWAAARKYCKDRDWQFQIWTEDTIDKFW